MNYQIILTYSSITYFLVAVRDLTDFFYRCFIFAGIEGFEPTTLGLTGHSSNHCSYIPKLIINHPTHIPYQVFPHDLMEITVTFLNLE